MRNLKGLWCRREGCVYVGGVDIPAFIPSGGASPGTSHGQHRIALSVQFDYEAGVHNFHGSGVALHAFVWLQTTFARAPER